MRPFLEQRITRQPRFKETPHEDTHASIYRPGASRRGDPDAGHGSSSAGTREREATNAGGWSDFRLSCARASKTAASP